MIKNMISIIENEINITKHKKSEIYKSIQETITNSNSLINKINTIYNDPTQINILTTEDYIELEKFCDKSTLQNLKAYKIVLTNNHFELYDEYLQKTKNIFLGIKEKNDGKNDELLKTNEEFTKISAYLDNLKKLSIKLKNDSNLESEDIDLIINACKNFGKSSEEITEIIIYVANKYIKEFNLQSIVVDLNDSLSNEDIDEELDELEETNLSEEELVYLFSKYGYDFLQFDKLAIESMKKYGNIQNIDAMLSVLKRENINISISSCSKFLAEIFVYSNSQLFEKTLLLAKSKGLNLTTDFNQLIKIPGIFLNKKRDLLRLSIAPGGDGTGNVISGSHEDFEKNIDLIESLFKKTYPSQPFSSVFRKCCFIFCKPHKMIKNAINTYKEYGISPEKYLKTLSGLNSYSQADILDLAIELDCLGYIKENLSNAILLPDNKKFFIIARAKQLGYTDDKIFNDNKFRVKELTMDSNIGINNFNGAIVTGKYVATGVCAQIFQEYESILMESMKNKGVDFSYTDQLLSNTDSSSKINKVESLYSVQHNPFIYNINGVIVSRPKFLRICGAIMSRDYDETEDLILFALTRNSIINQQQFDMIHDLVKKLYNNKELKK